MAKKPLSEVATRSILTDRECCAVLGGIIGGLARVANPEDVRAAVTWWAETPEAWKMFEEFNSAFKNVVDSNIGVENAHGNS